MEIKKGMKFRCINDVVMDDEEVAYCIGAIYTSEENGCITDMQNDKEHKWEKLADEYFEKIEEEMNYDLEKTVVHCTTRDELEKVYNWNIKQGFKQYSKYGLEKWYDYHKDNTYIELKNEFWFGDIKEEDAIRKTIISFSLFERDFLNKEQPEQPESSVKNDFKDGKLRWDLLPLELVEELVKVYDYGAKKYYPESWKEIPDGYQRLKAASLRHLVAFEKGETNDSESGLNHLACAAWNMLTCMYYAKLKEKEE